MFGNDGNLRRFHDYSRAQRMRIRRAVAQARRDQLISSSDEDDNPQQPQRNPNNVEQQGDHSSSSPSDSSSSDSSQPGRPESPEQASPATSRNTSGPENISSEESNSGDNQRAFDDSENDQHEDPEEHENLQEDNLNPDDGQHVAAIEQNAEVPEVGNVQEGTSDDSDGSELEDPDWLNNDDVDVYALAPITLCESMYATLCFFLRHNLPLSCLSDLLDLINLHCRREGNRFPKSLYLFKKYFRNLKFPLRKRFYCSRCFRNIEDEINGCLNCNQAVTAEYFIEVPFLTQLKSVLKRPGFRDKLNYRFTRQKFVNDNLEDIYDGAVYRELSAEGGILSSPLNISLMWYTDGVSIFKSSKYEIWPFYLVINALPYNERTKVSNALLAGLWFGKKKPVPTTFLAFIRQDILRLRNGININFGNPNENVGVKGIVISGTADLVAKAKFLNMKGHNGYFGCPKCKLRSQNIRRGLNVYPFRNNLELRTDEETLQFAQEALQSPLRNGLRQDVYGIKGPSVLATFTYQYVRTTAVDVMHCAYIYLTKSLLQFWFNPKHHDSPFSLSLHKGVVSKRLSELTPPNFVQRLTRTLDDVKYWKAHEMKAFLFYYSLPVVEDILPELYFSHHKLLLLGLYLLNQRSISENMLDLASDLLQEYVSQFEDLYGIDYMTCNLHQLLLLSTTVRDFGPLWVTSCFPFEDLNGKLKKFVKGTRKAELQVCSGVSMMIKLSELKQRVLDRQAKKFAEEIFDSNCGRKLTAVGNNMAIVAKYRGKNALPAFIQRTLNQANIVGHNFYEFYRLKKYCLVYTSLMYDRIFKSKSYCIKYKHRGSEEIGYINRFLRVTACACENFCLDCEATNIAIVQECQVTQNHSAWDGAQLNFIHTLHDFGDLIAIETSNILSMCFIMSIQDQNKTYIVEPVNLIEAE